MPKHKRAWTVWVETAVDVEAFDADSAKKKAAKAFTSRVSVAPDVALNGQAHVYEPEPATVS